MGWFHVAARIAESRPAMSLNRSLESKPSECLTDAEVCSAAEAPDSVIESERSYLRDRDTDTGADTGIETKSLIGSIRATPGVACIEERHKLELIESHGNPELDAVEKLVLTEEVVLLIPA